MFDKFQKRPENGTDPVAWNGRSGSGADQNAQLPTVRIKSLTSEFLQVEYIISRQRRVVTVSIYERGGGGPSQQIFIQTNVVFFKKRMNELIVHR